MSRRAIAVLSVLAACAGLTALAAPAAADPAPDLSVIALNPNDPHIPRGQDFTIRFGVSGTATDATLTVTVPDGTDVRSATDATDGAAVACTPAAGSVACALGAISSYTNVDMVFRLRADAATGAELPIVGTISSTAGPDVDPQNDSYTTGVIVVGRAQVTQAQSVKQVNVPLGGSAPFTVTLHNDGPDPATNVRTRFTVQSNDNPRPVLAGFSSDRVSQVNGGFEWTPGTLAVGGSVSLIVTVTATSPAVDSAITYSTSYDGVGEICQGSASCLFGAPIRTVVASGSTPTAPPTAPPTGAPILAATGSQDGPLTLLAGALLLVGAGLGVAGRRRRV